MTYTNCPACKTETTNNEAFCSTCNFPYTGTDKEKAIHIGQFIKQKGVITDSGSSIERSQKILYIVSLINLLLIMYNFLWLKFPITLLLPDTIVAIILTFCAYKIHSNPLLFIIIPLTLLIVIYTINYFIDPYLIIRGILFKLIILGSLIYSIYMIYNAKQFKKKFNLD